MATDFFLKLDGIEGQSNDKAHAKWIELLGFYLGSEQNITLARGVDVAGRGQFKPFGFKHLVDKATPKLQQFCMNGQKIAKAELSVNRQIAGAQVEVFNVKLENVKISKAEISVEALEDGGAEPVENVEMVAGKITWKVVPIKADNTKDGAIEACFDQISNS